MFQSLKNNWISSPRFDLSFIILPPILGLFFGIILSSDNQLLQSIQVQLVVVLVIIDLAHLISMWFRIYTSGQEGPREIKKYWLIYAGLIALFFTIGMFKKFNYVFPFITYFAIFHNIRQNYGFYSFYRKNETKNLNEIKFEKFFFHLISLFPLILWHMNPKGFDNYWSRDFLSIPYIEYLKLPLIIVFGASIILYCVLSFRKYKNNDLSPTKIIFLLAVTFGWYGTMLVAKETLSLFLAIISAHAIAYLFFVWKLYNNQMKSTLSKVTDKILLKKNLVFFGFVLCFGYIARGFIETSLQSNGLRDFWGAGFWHELGNVDNNILLVFLFVFPFATQVSHFVIDGFIWKPNRKKA